MQRHKKNHPKRRPVPPGTLSNRTLPAAGVLPVPGGEGPHPIHASRIFWILCGWFLAAWGLLYMRQYHWVVPPTTFEKSLEDLLRIWSLLGTGILLVFWGLLSLPNRGSPDDTGKTASRIVLFLILALTVAMRVYHFDRIEGKYWQDFALPLGDASLILNLRHWFVIGHFQPGEAFYPYLIAGILGIFPDMAGYTAQRIASLSIDVAAVWVYYLLGKEFGKRRIGLILAAFGAVTKPMMALYLCFMRMPGVSLAVALVLLFTLRIARKPTWGHFLQWGLAVAFGYYTYTAYRPMGPYFVLAVLLWVLFRNKERPLGRTGWTLGLGLLSVIGLLFTYEHRFIFKEGSLLWSSLVFLVEKARFAVVAAVFLVIVLFRHVREARAQGRDPVILRWFLASTMALSLVIPVFRVVYFSQRLTPASFMTQPVVEETLQSKFWTSFQSLVYAGFDRDDMNLYGDSFFDIPSLIFILLGILFVLAKPTWPRIFVLGAALVGMVPHVLADPGGSRFSGCIAPFLLLGALGVDRVIDAASLTARPALWRRIVVFLFAGLVLTGAVVVFKKEYFHFMTNWNAPVVLARQAIQDEEAGRRVYSGIYADLLASEVLLDKRRVHLLMPSTNPILLGPGEKAPDVVLLFDSRYSPAPDTLDRIRRDFPQAVWERRSMYPWMGECDIEFIRVMIPSSSITEDDARILHVRRHPGHPWLLRYYGSEYRMGRGLILQEERVPELRAFLPVKIRAREARLYDYITTGHETDLDLSADGLYLFKMKAPMSAELWVDGKRVISLRPKDVPIQRIGGLTLSRGKHRLVLRTYPLVDMDMPHVWVRHPGTPEWRQIVRGSGK